MDTALNMWNQKPHKPAFPEGAVDRAELQSTGEYLVAAAWQLALLLQLDFGPSDHLQARGSGTHLHCAGLASEHQAPLLSMACNLTSREQLSDGALCLLKPSLMLCISVAGKQSWHLASWTFETVAALLGQI